jgi:hypothetical protein
MSLLFILNNQTPYLLGIDRPRHRLLIDLDRLCHLY